MSRFRGATVGIPNGIPIIGEPKPVAELRVTMFDDGGSAMRIPPNNDVAWAAIGRVITVLLSQATVEMKAPSEKEEKTPDGE